MVFGISQMINMPTKGTSKACLRMHYSSLNMAGATMIMDILREQVLITARQRGNQMNNFKFICYLIPFSFSGLDPNKPCVIPFHYYGHKKDKCAVTRFGVVGSVDVSNQKIRTKICMKFWVKMHGENR